MLDNKDWRYAKKTKIICTIGPASDKKSVLKEMILAGMNVVRINMSHGTFDEHLPKFIAIRELNKEMGTNVSILLDTKGPEIRIGEVKDGKQEIKGGATVEITAVGYPTELSTSSKIVLSYEKLVESVKVGQEILVDDGKLSLVVSKVNAKSVTAIAGNHHFIKTKKAINIPGIELKLPFVSKYDKECIEWGLDQGIDYIAASFVSSAADVKAIRDICLAKGKPNVQIMSKIESLRSVTNLNEIVTASDAIMLARGDLGVEIPFEKVPFYENLISQKAKFFRKPIVIATQMLETMQENPRPTRAEVTDVYYAVSLGVDATMLSGESAGGEWPVQSVRTMALIDRESELNFDYKLAYEQAYAYVQTANAEIAYAVAKLANEERYPYIIAFTKTGGITKALSQYRPNSMIISVSDNADLTTYFGAWYGVYTMNKANAMSLYKDQKAIDEIIKHFGIPKNAHIIVTTSKEYKTIVAK